MSNDEWKVYEFIVRYKARNDGIAPTLMEMRKGTEIYNHGRLRSILHKLQEDKLILTGRVGTARNIKVIGGRWIGPLKTMEKIYGEFGN